MTDNKKYHHGNLKDKLIETALKIISEQGLEKITMRSLAEKIGVSRTAPYRHFPDKDALLCAIAEQGYTKFTEEIKKNIGDLNENPLLKLKKVGMAYVEFAIVNPVHYRLMFGNEIVQSKRTPELEKCVEQVFKNTLDLIEICQEKNLIRPINPYIIANSLWSMSHGISTLLNDGQIDSANAFKGMPAIMTSRNERSKADVNEIINHMTDILMNGFIAK